MKLWNVAMLALVYIGWWWWCCHALLALAIAIGDASAPNNNKTSKVVPGLFVFGDSLVDTGNNNYLLTLAHANYPPYGMNFHNHRATGRFSDGLLIVDYLASYLGIPFVPPYLSTRDDILEGVCFASAGSGIMDKTGEIFGQHISMNDQIEYFKELNNSLTSKLGMEKASHIISKSLYVVVMGSNDFLSRRGLAFDSYLYGDILSSSKFQEKLLFEFLQQISELYKVGARKMVIAAIPAIGCIPSVLYETKSSNGECNHQLNNAVKIYNSALFESLKELRTSLDGVKIVYANAFDPLFDILNNLKANGFDNGQEACCGFGKYNGATPCLPLSTPICKDPMRHVFWDRVHPSGATYNYFAKLFWEGSSKYVYPINVKKLASL